MKTWRVTITTDPSVDAKALREFLDAMPTVCAEDCPAGFEVETVESGQFGATIPGKVVHGNYGWADVQADDMSALRELPDGTRVTVEPEGA